MWKAFIGLVIGIVIGMMVAAPVAGGKKKSDRSRDGILEDTNRDGIVEFFIPLWKPYEFVHISCSDGFSHDVFSQVVVGPIGLPRLYMRWTVNLQRTHIERVKKFGPGYRHSIDPFAAEYDRYKRTPAW